MVTAVDLFAGGGGLTVGLKRAGFHVVSAVEIEPHAFSTYKVNHPEVMAFKQDIRTIDGIRLKRTSPTGEIDLLTGCPPCQGFSSLTSKYKREDPRNELINEMGRLVEEVLPKAVMIENVPGLGEKGRVLLDKFLTKIRSLGYIPTYAVLQTADYGVPQQRRRFVLLAGRGFEIALPKPTHSRTGENGTQTWKRVRDAIEGMPPPIELSVANKKGGPLRFNWHVVRSLSETNKERLRYAKPGKVWTEIPEYLRPPCHRGKYKGFANVYGRLDWDQPSVTITGGCTTLSKGRFGHPCEERTISVREAALLQTFPGNYIFDTPYMDHACQIVGNALPCDFAEAISRQCMEAIVRDYEYFKDA